MSEHKGNIRRWIAFAEKMKKWKDWSGDSTYEADDEGLTHTAQVSQAQLISSELSARPGFHYLAIDVDMSAALVPSSTEGHYHLLIGHAMSWPTYEKVLVALNEAGIISDGYLGVAQRRKRTDLRTPWTHKKGRETSPTAEMFGGDVMDAVVAQKYASTPGNTPRPDPYPTTSSIEGEL